MEFVKYAYEWGESELVGQYPDEWQQRYLYDLGVKIRKNAFNGLDPVDPIRDATASGHGIGKSALVAWLVDFIMVTRPYSKGIVTASTSRQLLTKTWPEIAKWTRRMIFRDFFEITSGSGNMKMVMSDFADSWRVDGLTCRKEESESFAGLHCINATPFYIFDEASAVPKEIWEVAEGGLTDGEPMLFAFGNYTRNTGKFHECFTKQKHRWSRRQIDSRKCKIPNKKLIAQWVADFGEDSDFVRTRVRGLPPKQSSMQFISVESVSKAQNNEPISEVYDPMLLGVDIARGGDDNSVLYPRKGMDARTIPYKTLDTRDTMEIVSAVQELHREYKFDGIFVDVTGVGAGVYDRLLQLGLPVYEVYFGGRSPSKTYGNMRGYIWGKVKDALPHLAIPDVPELEQELISVDYFHHTTNNTIMLEPKEAVKEKCGSPDIADALCLTYAFHVEKAHSTTGGKYAAGQQHESEYDPTEVD